MLPNTWRGVVVLMTTIPKRIEYIEPVIDSMLRQTWPASEPWQVRTGGSEWGDGDGAWEMGKRIGKTWEKGWERDLGFEHG